MIQYSITVHHCCVSSGVVLNSMIPTVRFVTYNGAIVLMIKAVSVYRHLTVSFAIFHRAVLTREWLPGVFSDLSKIHLSVCVVG